jgi:uncharacterized tellurite resistance protein B-like protein
MRFTMSDPLIKDRVCVRKPATQEEWVELIKKLEDGGIDDMPVSVMLRLAEVLDISHQELIAIFEKSE